MKKVYKKIVTLMCAAGICGLVYAQTIEDEIRNGNVPLPADAEYVQRPTVSTQGVSGAVVAYVTSLSKKEVVEFYKEALAQRGWGTKETLTEMLDTYGVSLQTLPGNTKRAADKGILNNIMYFRKNQDRIMLVVSGPVGVDKKTLFSLGYLKEGGSSLYRPITSASADALKDIVPQYPGAQLITRIGSSYIFSAKDDIESVVYFYKREMTAYGWYLEGETPVEENRIQIPQGVMQPGGTAPCASCAGMNGAGMAQALGQMPEGLRQELKKGMLVRKGTFKFSRGDEQCQIIISETKSALVPENTQISINYRK